MAFYIYKITNKVNGKFYIGKTTGTLQKRFQKHIFDALSFRVNTHLANAIRKDGPENFFIEALDTAFSEEELDQKEKYWISFLDAINKGYNLSDGGEGGNTYKYKTSFEMDNIKDKIRQAKIGNKNPNAKAVKCKNVITNEELFFDTVLECQKYFKEDQHSFITRRCLHKTKYAYKGQWLIAYVNDDYWEEGSTQKEISRKCKVKIIKISTGEEYVFNSYTEAERYFNLSRGFFHGIAYKYKDKDFWEKDDFRIFKLK